MSCWDSLSNCHIQLSPEKCRSHSVVLTNSKKTGKGAESETGRSEFAWEQSSFSTVISWQIRFFGGQVFRPRWWAVFLAQSWTKLSVRLELWAIGGCAVLFSGGTAVSKSPKQSECALVCTDTRVLSRTSPTGEWGDKIAPGHGKLFFLKIPPLGDCCLLGALHAHVLTFTLEHRWKYTLRHPVPSSKDGKQKQWQMVWNSTF